MLPDEKLHLTLTATMLQSRISAYDTLISTLVPDCVRQQSRMSMYVTVPCKIRHATQLYEAIYIVVACRLFRNRRYDYFLKNSNTAHVAYSVSEVA